tara:strand:+ start:783 stop:1028 length:246 start_codon:yes stop_codon:yes gene_type:complete
MMPYKNELTKNLDGDYTIEIIDEEGDPITCTFHYDDCVHVDTKGYTYLTLSIVNLTHLLNLIEKTTDLYNKKFKTNNYENY